jgi:transcriptional regulator with XRE-family HTH domain
MATNRRKQVAYDTVRMRADMARRGWEDKDLAFHAGVSKMTVSRFLRRERQTVKTAARLSEALRRSPAYYLLLAGEPANRSHRVSSSEKVAS